MANNVFNSIVGTALADGYGVLGLNVFDELTLRTAVEAAESQGASLIVQTSVKTVKAIGAKRLSDQFKLATSLSLTPVALHLDHCPDRAVISECIREGWDSVLFDASSLPLHIATAQTKEVVEEAHAQGVNVEGEIEGIQGVEDGIGSDDVPLLYPIETVIDFIETTRIDCFAPAIGNAHGLYKQVPQLDVQRVRDIVAATNIPMALHGGSGLSSEQFSELIAAGCAKVNISTALKKTYIEGFRSYLTEHTSASEPLTVIEHVRQNVRRIVVDYIHEFGSSKVIST
ncbi:D-tagatose-1,6-bisphosphate aldolase subunit GatY [Mycolicibacterium vanbaalenii]|uniref:D-tagatose-1,6-bisphosphate aldolase subunit GatY n=1 Tax=Mycolicibacterium vanbaalenii TaxID=110539 RepID=A0A5S9P9W1_MYCVN|nr:class II fructose-bisphosphate aldolase [Mycolicibacterium vanbaalenii]CAA0100143.1 D-tagatose-1,6-bisphosphate aldolase subunit GatY [Mycolicibacterium vanbaalenii]